MASVARSRRSARCLQFFGALGDALLQLLVQRLQLPAFAMQLGKDADFRAQQFGNDRDGDVVNGALAIAFDSINVGEVNAGDEDDRGLLKAGMLADHLGQIEAIDVGHADIRQHDGDVFLQQMLERFVRRRGLDQVLAKLRQDDLIAEELGRLIVDHENVYFLS